jgi:hypothetical protein
MVHPCNPLLKRQRQEDMSLRPAQAKAVRPCLNNKVKTKRLRMWFKWQNTHLACKIELTGFNL